MNKFSKYVGFQEEKSFHEQAVEHNSKNVVHLGKLNPPDESPLPQIKVRMTGNAVWPDCDSVLLCSGGMDSVTLGHFMKKELKKRPIIIFFAYGQKTMTQEWLASITLSNDLMCPFLMIDLGNFHEYINSSILKGQPDSDIIEHTVVPGRNLLFVSWATSIAQSNDIKEIYIGVQSGDAAGYPDCKPAFWKKINTAILVAYNVTVETPFIHMTKKEIVDIGKKIGVDYSDTYSCYRNDRIPCGECPSCKLRTEAGL